MRKISTLLTMLFLLCGVCMAQSSRVVYLKTTGRVAAGSYMNCNASGGLGSVTAKDNSALWVLSPVSGKADTYTLRNAGNAGYVKAFWTTETQWQTVANASEASEFVLEDLGGGKFGFRKPDAASNSINFAHLAGDKKRIVIWYSSEDASKWTIEDVEGETKANVLANVEYMGKLQSALANAEMNYGNTLPSNYEKVGDKLLTNVNQLWCNLPQNADDGGVSVNHGGAWNDGQGLSALIDGDTGTFFHSRWGGVSEGSDFHYLQVTIPESVDSTDFIVEYAARVQANAANRPTEIDVYGATGTAENLVWGDAPFLQLTTADGLGETSGSFQVIQQLPLSDRIAYRALRFVVKATSNNADFAGYPFFTYSEFQLFAAAPTKGPKYSTATSENQAKLYEAMQLAANLDVTKDDFKKVAETIETAVAEVREELGGEMLDLTVVIDEAKNKLAEMSDTLGTPGRLGKADIEKWEKAIAEAQAAVEDNNNPVFALNCNEARCQLEKFIAANSMSNVNIDADDLTTGLFTIVNPNALRGAVVRNKAESDNHLNSEKEEYLWFAEAKDVNENSKDHLWGFFKNEKTGEVYLYNVGKYESEKNSTTGYNCFANPCGQGSYGETWVFTSLPSPITFEAMEAPKVRIMGDGKTMSISRSYNGPVITYYALGDGGVPFEFKRVKTLTEAEVNDVNAKLQYNLDRLELVRPLRDRIDYLWDMMAEEKARVGEIGHLNDSALAVLDTLVAEANEAANVIVITNTYESSSAVLAALNAAVAALYADGNCFVKPENGKYYVIKSDNSDDAHYHLAHFLIHNAAYDLLAVPNSQGEFEKTPWHCVENEDGTFDFTNNNRYLAFGETSAEAYGWTLGAPLRRAELEKNSFGWLSLYSKAEKAYLAVNAENAGMEAFVPAQEFTFTPDMTDGTLYKSGTRPNETWNNTWVSADEPVFTLHASANNMTKEDGDEYISLLTGNSENCTYSVAANGAAYPMGNVILNNMSVESIEVKVAMKAGKTTTLVANGKEYELKDEDQTILIEGDKFVLQGKNGNAMLLKEMNVKVHGLLTPTADLSTDFIFEAVEVDEAGNIAGGTTVGIDRIFGEAAHDVYSLSGVLVRKQATNLNGLQKGIYVVNGQKVVVK